MDGDGEKARRTLHEESPHGEAPRGRVPGEEPLRGEAPLEEALYEESPPEIPSEEALREETARGNPREKETLRLPHLRADGSAFMVDVTAKTPSVREATAVAEVACSQRVMEALRTGTVPKGDVLAVARVAGIMGAKHAPDLLPLAHRIGVHGCELDLTLEADHVAVRATTRTADRTGVEMEALTAVTVAALAVIDMVKGVDRSALIRSARIVHKSGGRSGDWTRPGEPESR